MTELAGSFSISCNNEGPHGSVEISCLKHQVTQAKSVGAFCMSEQEFVEWFWSNVAIQTAEKCWVWTHSRNKRGYGLVRKDGKRLYAHRASFALHNGYEPSQNVLHSCDNVSCVNPYHLRDGSQLENVKDRQERQRSAWHRHPETMLANLAKSRVGRLSDEQVDTIRRRYAGGESAKAIASDFGISFDQVPRIARGKQYRYDRQGNEMPLYKKGELHEADHSVSLSDDCLDNDQD